MRSILLARTLVAMLAGLAGCGNPAATATAGNTETRPNSDDREKRTMTTIEIDACTRQWTAHIPDTPSARDFLAQLPLELKLTDYAATEKVAALPRPLTRDGAPAAVTPRAGEIGYYAPWGNIVIYHKDGPYSPGLILLGRIYGNYADLAKPGAMPVTIRRKYPARTSR